MLHSIRSTSIPVAICTGVLKLDGSGLLELRLTYMYAKLRAPSLIIPCLTAEIMVCSYEDEAGD
jgi:hypothetical protein